MWPSSDQSGASRRDQSTASQQTSPISCQASPLFTAAQSREPEKAGTTDSSIGICDAESAGQYTGQLKGINQGHQTDGVRLPGQRTLFHEDQERLSR
jgi:hypothetical protein